MYRSLFWFVGAVLFGLFLVSLYHQILAPQLVVPAQEVHFQKDIATTVKALKKHQASIRQQLGQPQQELYVLQQPKASSFHHAQSPAAIHFLKTEPRPQLRALDDLHSLSQQLEAKEFHRFWLGTLPALNNQLSLSLARDLGPVVLFSLGLLIIYSFSSLELFGRYSLSYTGILMLVVLWVAFASPSFGPSLASNIGQLTAHDHLCAAHIELLLLLAISCSCNWHLLNNMQDSNWPKTRFSLTLIQTLSIFVYLVPLLNDSPMVEQRGFQQFILGSVFAGHLFSLYSLTILCLRKQSALSKARYSVLLLPLVILGMAILNQVFHSVPQYWLSWGLALTLLASTLINVRYQLLQKEKKLSEELSESLQQKTLHLEHKNQELRQAKYDLQAANLELKALSFTDALTGAYNRLYFDRQFLVEWQRARREQQTISLVLIDIDHFKELNDQYGHLAGDEGLKMMSQLLKQHFQRGSDVACRYGGEEFVVLLPNTPPEQAAIRANKLRQELEMSPVIYKDQIIPITASFGVGGIVPQPEHEPLQLLHATDQALYWVKRHGRNGVHISEALMEAEPA